ncbi:E3 ubiquitin-protein ligase TRIP12 [Portunus trituberculatus]|uniref:E3 ubiquitin-protein ligase n=1 Tax=Portunus trituberculatus TaxID=210409 RepID=A0A5B7J8J4_PORTR|nr:E3 ubiquitin-protein ligase TRIP12 [Portunus trituberculatus]
MLSSLDLKIIVGAVQMSEILMAKLPEIFAVYFRREGVMHQIKRLCDPEATLGVPAARWSSPELSIAAGRGGSLTGSPFSGRAFNGNCLENPALSLQGSQEEERGNSPSQMRLYDVLKRRRTARIRTGPWRKSRQEEGGGGGGGTGGGGTASASPSSSASSSFSEFFMKSECASSVF